MDHFTPVDTLDASNYLRVNIGSDLNATINFIMPVTGFENNGQSVTPEGFGKTYGMYLTLDGTDIANSNGSLNHRLERPARLRIRLPQLRPVPERERQADAVQARVVLEGVIMEPDQAAQRFLVSPLDDCQLRLVQALMIVHRHP